MLVSIFDVVENISANDITDVASTASDTNSSRQRVTARKYQDFEHQGRISRTTVSLSSS